MINTILSSIGNVITTCFLWVTQINEQLPFLTVALGVFLVYSLSRFFIYPMFKNGFRRGSDSVKERDKE